MLMMVNDTPLKFSRRYALASAAERWCIANGVSNSPLGIVSALCEMEVIDK